MNDSAALSDAGRQESAGAEKFRLYEEFGRGGVMERIAEEEALASDNRTRSGVGFVNVVREPSTWKMPNASSLFRKSSCGTI